MNPSATGWINKFGHLVQKQPILLSGQDELYIHLKKIGFVYGIHIDVFPLISTELRLTEDEIAKINLLVALYLTFQLERKEEDFDAFVDTVFAYYKSLEVGKISFLNKILSAKRTESQLEKLIDSRIYLGGSAFSRAFGNSITNSLLFVDVLIFRTYLNGKKSGMEHAKLLEYVTMNIAYHSLNSKESTKNDDKFIQLLASSLTYVDLDETDFDSTYRNLLALNFTQEEKNYFLDMACLTIWEDKSIDLTESNYIFELGKDLGKSIKEVENSMNLVINFFEKNKSRIGYLSDKNVAFQFYQGMSKNVSKLILRNSKRLKKELAESKELVSLLSKSTVKELTPEERRKMQNQLLDIFKTIPSLAIFMLPGGAVLLPIFIKLIPKLLPSAFDDNRVDEN
ncbi:LETM1-related biofilm-associated protein [Flagellimonas sp. S174]|uniref:LETM1-related biofilm-associated protein n=1 Tax=Flagellimonas sp. S174 TaxID=3410790 RepID=UPI003BF49300